MNKKTIAILVCAIAILAIVGISIWGIMADSPGDDVAVTGVEILNEADSTYEEGGVTVKRVLLNKGTTSFQLEWKILPASATNKNVTFLTSDASVATVNQETGLVTFLKEETVVITVKSEDSTNKYASIQLAFPVVSNTTVNVGLTSDGLSFTTADGAVKLFDEKDNDLILFNDVEYNLASDSDIAITVEGESVEVYGNILRAVGLGESLVTFKTTDNSISLTKKIIVNPYVTLFNQGTNYGMFLDTKNNLESSNYMNKTAIEYTVGTGNPFHFDILMQYDGANLNREDVELEYTVTAPENVNFADIARINEDNSITFLQGAVGNTYTVSVAPKYNVANKTPLIFTFIVNEGVNVWTHDELKAAFMNVNNKSINLLARIEAKLAPNEINADGTAKNYWSEQFFINTQTGELNNHGTPYKRGIPTTFNGVNELTINGNYFTVDGSKIPLQSATGEDGQVPPLSWAGLGEYKVASTQQGIFQFVDARSQGDTIVNFNNISILGNSSRSPIYTEDDDGNELTPEQINQRLANQGSGHAGVMTRGCTLNLNNAYVAKCTESVYASYQHAVINTNYTKIEDSWANAIFSWDGQSVTTKNTLLTKCGGAAISLTDNSYTDENSPVEADMILTLDEGTVVDNFLTGSEGWFVVNGFTGIVPKLKSEVNAGIASAGKAITKIMKINGKDTEVFNFILQEGLSDGFKPPVGQSEVDVQITVNRYIGKDKTTGESLYQTTRRVNGFVAGSIITKALNGTYLNAAGSYSTNETFIPVVDTVALVSTCLTQGANASAALGAMGINAELATQFAGAVETAKNQIIGTGVTDATQITVMISSQTDLHALSQQMITTSANEAALRGQLESNAQAIQGALAVSLNENKFSTAGMQDYLEIFTENPLGGKLMLYAELMNK